MADTLKFFESIRSPIFSSVAPGADGRLAAALKLTLQDAAGGSVDDLARFSLLSSADVAGLKAGAVLRVMPPRDSHDAETTKAVHVDFAEPDFPWRYTPGQPPKLQPWLIVLVGKTAEMKVSAGVVDATDSVLASHPLGNSYLWAHAQDDDRKPISRILSPCVLDEHSEYVAAIVPAFNEAGKPMWSVVGNAVTRNFGRAGILPAFDSWRFWTGDKGDFETLAEALRVRKSGDAGTVSLRYRRDVVGVDVTLQLRGAITSLKAEPDQAADVNKARADLDVLNNPLPETALDKYLGLPDYGRPWLADTDAAVWSRTLNEDPRFRAIAWGPIWASMPRTS